MKEIILMMKKIFTWLWIITIVGNNTSPLLGNSSYQANKPINKTKILISPDQNLKLTIAGDWATTRIKTAMIKLNLGKMSVTQLKGISSTNHDNYIEHKVVSYDYYLVDQTEICTYFNEVFHYDKFNMNTEPPFSYNFARKNAIIIFYRTAWWGAAFHKAIATIKFSCYLNNEKELMLCIYVTLKVKAKWSLVKSIASFKLGSSFTIYYIDK